jgi:Transposase IS116/IS110/IS902 family
MIAERLHTYHGYQAIRQLPGIGPVLAAVFVAEIGDVHHPTTAKISADKQRVEARRGKTSPRSPRHRKLLTLVYYELRDGHIRALDRARAA